MKSLRAIFTMHTMQSFTLSLVGIFIPIYLINLGYGVHGAILYFIYHYSFLMVFAFLSIYIASRIGLQWTIIARFPFQIIYLLLLFFLKDFPTPLYVIALFSGLQSAMYWIPLHILFSQNTENRQAGSSTSKLFALPKLAGLAGPLIGGVIISYFGFNFLFLIVLILLLVSVSPLAFAGINRRSFTFSGGHGHYLPQLEHIIFSIPHNIIASIPRKASFRFEWKKGWEMFKKYPKYFWAEIFDNMGEEVNAIIWPIFVYLFFKNTISVGFIGTLIAITSALFTLFIGKMSDKHDKNKIIKIGGLLLSLNWLLRYFVDDAFMIYLTSVLSGFFFTILLVPYTSGLYNLSRGENADEFFVFREIPVGISRIAILTLSLFLLDNLNNIFLIPAFAYLYFLFF